MENYDNVGTIGKPSSSSTASPQKNIDQQSSQSSSSLRDNDNSNDDEEEEEDYARQRLAEITRAYEILSDDHTRLLYHRYGLVGGTDAAIQMLTGQAGGIIGFTEEQARLLELMGYPPRGYPSSPIASSWFTHRRGHHNHHHRTPPGSRPTSQHRLRHHQQHQQRLAYLGATIAERLRPLVEGAVSQEIFVNDVYHECNALKKSPLGAQILRCIGRAYRIEGYRALREMHRGGEGNTRSGTRRPDEIFGKRGRGGRNDTARRQVTDGIYDKWRDAKHYSSAALAGGKLVLMEQRLKKLESEFERQKEARRDERRRRWQSRQTTNGQGLKRIQDEVGRGVGSGIDGGDVYEEGHAEKDTHFASNIGALPGDDDGEADHSIVSFSDDDDENFFHLLEYDDDHGSGSESDGHDELELELQHVQHQKTYSALLSVHQMEALWKITKIELDKIVREACRWILTEQPTMMGHHNAEAGWYAFRPSKDPPWPPPPPRHRHRQTHERRRGRDHHVHSKRPRIPDGWVGTTGEAVLLEVGRLRAAAALILFGDLMVQCSKEGTAWNK